MRILIVGPSTERSKGGMATVITDQLTNPILNKDNELSYLISHVEGSLFEKILYSIKSVYYIIANRRKYDIIHLHSAADLSFYRKSILLRVGKLFHKKAIIHLHAGDFEAFYLKRKSFLRKYIENTLRLADEVLVLSDYWKSFFDANFTNVNVEVLKNGVDIKAFEASRNQSESFNKFLFLGRLKERKGIYDLLDAIDIIVNQQGLKMLEFYLAGDGEIDQVNRIISDKKIEKNVKLLGWLNDDKKKEILRSVQTVILPSYEEGLPMALIEAMASGKVVISTDVGGIPDLIKNDYNGYLLNAGDIEQLVKFILHVNNNPAQMRIISQNNIDTILRNFNQEVLSEKLLDIYKSL